MLNYISDIVIKRHDHCVKLVNLLCMYIVTKLALEGAFVDEKQSRIVNRDGKVISEWSH